MAAQSLPTKTPSRRTRPARRSGGQPTPPASTELTTDTGVEREAVAVPRSSQPLLPSLVPQGSATRNSTLLFRALLLLAAAVALAFTIAALIAPPGQLSGSGSGDMTSPDAPPPAVLVQSDG